MQIKTISYLQSVVHWKDAPEAKYPEYAFVGRSNVGKSSLVNMLANHDKLAKTSSKPGKTQTINHFVVNDEWYLVDLPGYGYAKTSKTMREKWSKMVLEYITHRENLMLLFILIDSRLELQSNDLEIINLMGEWSIPFALIFTKTDKLSKTKLQKNIEFYQKQLSEFWDPLPDMLISSAETGEGREQILQYIEEINDMYRENKIKQYEI